MVRKLTIAYRGAAYSGWQRQDNARTVQQVIEEALSALAGKPLRIVGASRTDAGVHARGQVAHLEGADGLPDRALVFGVNHHLPEDVRILDIERMLEGFHARKCAESKLYSYRLIRTEVLSPVDAPYAVRVNPQLDIVGMQKMCDLLVGEHDFSAFALTGGSHRCPRRRIFSARCEERGAEILFLVSGNGFLRGMVRALVGTLIEVGLRRRSLDGVSELLRGGDRAAAGPTAPACGLTLEGIEYSREWTPVDARS